MPVWPSWNASRRTANKPSFIRDDLLVKVQTADHLDADEVIAQLTERAAFADAKVELFSGLLRQMRGKKARPIAFRASELNHRIRAAALRHGVVVAETAHHPVVTDPRPCSPARWRTSR